jgi:hypothetical protein
MEATKMAIDDDAGDGVGTAVVDSPSTKPAVIAQLTWAKLYTKAMHKDMMSGSAAPGIARDSNALGGLYGRQHSKETFPSCAM